MNFQNTIEMENIFGEIARNALDYVTSKMVDEIQNEIDAKNIGTGMGKVYKPTGEFREAWFQDYARRHGDTIEGGIFYDGGYLSLANDPSDSYPNNFVHGSGYTLLNPWYISDVRNALPEIIFEGLAGDIFGEGFWTSSRDAWKPFLSRTEKSFAKWLREGFELQGIKLDTSRTYKSSF